MKNALFSDEALRVTKSEIDSLYIRETACSSLVMMHLETKRLQMLITAMTSGECAFRAR